jgi:hypothetical protein
MGIRSGPWPADVIAARMMPPGLQWRLIVPAALLPFARQLTTAADHQIRRSRRIIQDRPMRSVGWADIPQLSARVRCCLAAWQQLWQQSRPYRTDADLP